MESSIRDKSESNWLKYSFNNFSHLHHPWKHIQSENFYSQIRTPPLLSLCFVLQHPFQIQHIKTEMDGCLYWSLGLFKVQTQGIGTGLTWKIKPVSVTTTGFFSGSYNDFEMAGILDRVFKTKDYLLIFRNVISLKDT